MHAVSLLESSLPCVNIINLAAREWFKAHSPLEKSMKAYQTELTAKIAEAKTTGERANKSRF